jgi:transposase-like protein
MKTGKTARKSIKMVRRFSEEIQRQTVSDIESGKCSVTQAGRELGVSVQSIYKWIYKYSRYLVKNKVMVIENQSEGYRTKELEAKIKELEAALGRKTIENAYLEKIIDLANEDLGTDLKKNFKGKL